MSSKSKQPRHITILVCQLLLLCGLLPGCTRHDLHSDIHDFLYDDIYPPYPPPDLPKLETPRNLVVLLDAGHGGEESGTSFFQNGQNYCEDELNQDVVRRLQDIVANNPSHIRMQTMRVDQSNTSPSLVCDDGSSEYFLHPDGHSEAIRSNREGGLSQRVDMINAWYEQYRATGTNEEDIVLLSIHFDHGKPYMYGLHMLYPGLAYDQQKQYDATSRYRHSLPRTWTSLELGTYLMQALEQEGIVLHTSEGPKPAYLFQGYLAWPDAEGKRFYGRVAIMAHTPPMAKLLIEVENTNNFKGRLNTLNPDYREAVARGIWRGLLAYSYLALHRDIPAEGY